MKQSHSLTSRRFLSIIIILIFITQIFMFPSFAWNGTPKASACNVYFDNTCMASENQIIQIESDEGSQSFYSSLLCGGLVYLPLAVLIECGADISFDEESLSASINYMDCTNCHPIFQRTSKFGNIAIDQNFQMNCFNIYVDGEQLAWEGKDLTYNKDNYPSSIWAADTVYFPIEPILQKLGIGAHWITDANTYVIEKTLLQSGKVGLANFKRSKNVSTDQFTDVLSSKWYAEKVKTVCEYGLMSGTSSTSFSPEKNMSIAEAITVAAQLNNTYYAKQYEFPIGSPWYQPYVEYALEEGIISKPYDNYGAPISRGEFAIIISNVFSLPVINEIEDSMIPDVPSGSSYYDAVYYLYRAGIISGTDSYGTFKPDAEISRAEVSVILGNMVDSSLRKHFALPSSIVLPHSKIVPVGETQTISVQITPDGALADTQITWTSSKPSVATVDSSGKVYGNKTGTSTITATTPNGKTASCIVNVQSMAELDIRFAKDATNRLKSQLKFPDTLKIHGIWADTFPNEDGTFVTVIYIYYSGENSLGSQVRAEYSAYYTVETQKFIFDDSDDYVSTHTLHRTIDIKKVLQ